MMRPTQAAVNWQRRALPVIPSAAAVSSRSHASTSRHVVPSARAPSHTRPRVTSLLTFGPSGFIATQQQQQHRPSSSSSTSSRTNMALDKMLTYEFLDGLREFWFEHFASADSFVLPRQEEQMRWFMGGKELDEICVTRFAPVLEAIRASDVTTASSLLKALPPRGPLDWLALVILLDQIPRNCYRGEAAHVAFTFFDPLARDVTLAAMGDGKDIPHADPRIRWAFARRFWFYLPLMHAEDLATHERAVAEYARMAEDIEAVVSGTVARGDDCEEAREAARVAAGDKEGARTLARVQMEFEMKHYDIVRRFGRYPHRNGAMGRETTEDERTYLENGGETFGG